MREVKTYYIQDGNTVRYTTAEPAAGSPDERAGEAAGGPSPEENP